MPTLELDLKATKKIIAEFIQRSIDEAGLEGGVVGLSGGLDSAVTLCLSILALGTKNVLALILPYKESDPENIKDAEELAKKLCVRAIKLDITNLVEPFFSVRKGIDRIRKGNYLARIRMAILYDFSKEYRYMVLGTGNKSERLLGYTTIWGDMACGIAPIGDLYKTQVKALGGELGIPERIIQKTPSADLWKGQTDEGELGISYSRADLILHMFYDLRWGVDWIKAEGITEEEIDRVLKLYKKSEYKRRMPPFPRITTPED